MERPSQHDSPRVPYAVSQHTTREETAARHILLPLPSIWPLLTGAAVAASVVGLLFIDNYPWFSLITLPLLLAAILGWVLQKPVVRPMPLAQAGSIPAMATASPVVVEMPTMKLGSVSIPPVGAQRAGSIVDLPTMKLGSISTPGPSLAPSGQFKWGKPTPLPPLPAVTPLPALPTFAPYGQVQQVPPLPQVSQSPQPSPWMQQVTPYPASLSLPPPAPFPAQQGYPLQKHKKRRVNRGAMVALLCSIGLIVLVLGYGLTTLASNRNASKPAPAAQPAQVTVNNAGFSPTSLTIAPGTTVVWTNKSTLPHTVTDSGAFDSGNLPVGSSYRFTFTHPGTYHYTCSYHPFMLGTIIVQQT